jgi:hypothetical protein
MAVLVAGAGVITGAAAVGVVAGAVDVQPAIQMPVTRNAMAIRKKTDFVIQGNGENTLKRIPFFKDT